MDPDFWHERWDNNRIGFHEGEANALMVANFPRLSLAEESRIFVPLCGKTRDIAWLLSQGYRVAGVELSKLAIEQLFADLGADPEITTNGKLVHFRAPNIDIYVGDAFDLTAEVLDSVDAVYDRAALVALPKELRERYAAHVHSITRSAPQILISFEYEQDSMDGPPFSIDELELARVYGAHYDLAVLARVPLEKGLKSARNVKETVWLLR